VIQTPKTVLKYVLVADIDIFIEIQRGRESGFTSVLTASSEGLMSTTVSNTLLLWCRIFCPEKKK